MVENNVLAIQKETWVGPNSGQRKDQSIQLLEAGEGRVAVLSTRLVRQMQQLHVVGEVTRGKTDVGRRLLLVTRQHPDLRARELKSIERNIGRWLIGKRWDR